MLAFSINTERKKPRLKKSNIMQYLSIKGENKGGPTIIGQCLYQILKLKYAKKKLSKIVRQNIWSKQHPKPKAVWI